MLIYMLQATTTDWKTIDTVFLFFTREEAKQFAIEHNLKDYMISQEMIRGNK